MGLIEAICISKKKGERKTPVESAVVRADHGIESDAHAGSWHRQVSLLGAEDIQTVRDNLPDIAPGDFAENIILAGLDLTLLGLGSQLRLGGQAVLSITQIGKVCHTPCRIFHLTGDCIMPRQGLFARVLEGGRICAGDNVELLEVVPRETFQAVVLTISDECSRGEAQDTAGPAAVKRLQESLSAHIYAARIIPDKSEDIAESLKHYCAGHSIDLVVTVGPAGVSPRDAAPEATRQVIERPAPGLDEAMRAASPAETPDAELSRGVSGICGSTLIVNLPASQPGAAESLDAILPALQQVLRELRGDRSDSGRGQGG